MDDPILTARALVRDRCPDARAAFLAGSVLTERRTPMSDLDIVVVMDGPPAPGRETLVHRGWPVELFLQTEAVWRDFADKETAKRSSPLLSMCAEGMLLVDADGLGASLQEEARRRWAAGPPPLSERERDYLRYVVTDLLDDLRGCADPAERVYLVAQLLQRASELVLLVAATGSAAASGCHVGWPPPTPHCTGRCTRPPRRRSAATSRASTPP